MTILVTGSTGTVGSLVVEKLAAEGAGVRALVRKPSGRDLPANVTEVQGDLTDIDSVRAALAGVDTLFLLNAVTADELTQALVTLDVAVELGIERIVYFSVFNGALFKDVPHFTGKHLVEQVIDARALPATVLRPAYFIQNDAMHLPVMTAHGVYPSPIGARGIAMVDVRDIAEVAAIELLRRDRSTVPLPRTTIELVGPDTLTGEDIAAIWSQALGREIHYGGDDLDRFEQAIRGHMPGWQVRDLRLMMRGFHDHGMVPGPSMRSILAGLLGRTPRSYADFAREQAAKLKQEA